MVSTKYELWFCSEVITPPPIKNHPENLAATEHLFLRLLKKISLFLNKNVFVLTKEALSVSRTIQSPLDFQTLTDVGDNNMKG